MATKAVVSSKRGVLKCAKGYKFKKLGRNRIALMRNNNHAGTLSCECSTSGGCKIVIDPNDGQTASCLENGCSGSCGWVISVPGLAGWRFGVLA